MKDNPDCEYNPKISLSKNIQLLVESQKKEKKHLRGDLIWALLLARSIYPKTSADATTKKVIQTRWKARKHFKNGWYTYGGRKDETAFTAFVDSVVAAEKTYQQAVKEARGKNRGTTGSNTRSPADPQIPQAGIQRKDKTIAKNISEKKK